MSRKKGPLAAMWQDAGHVLRNLGRRYHGCRQVSGPPCGDGSHRPKVLVLGIYLADRPHTATHLVKAYAASTQLAVTQHWIGLNGAADSPALAAATLRRLDGFVPKFTLLNTLLRELPWQDYDWILISDDDIVVPWGFLDAYLGYQSALGFALAQPARTPWSYADHKFTRQAPRTLARETRFVEIGPVFSVDQRFARLIFPFDETSPMGWGYDYVWPTLAASHQLPMGIVDATPVDHSLRRQAVTYDGSTAVADMRRYFETHPHLSRREAFVVLAHHARQTGGPGRPR